MSHFNYSLEGLSRPVGLRAFMRRGLSQPSTSASTAFSTVKARRAATSKTSAIYDTAASEKLELDAGDAGVPTDTVSRPRVSMVSLGCPKNTVDGEVLLGDLFKSGFDIVDDHEDSDAIIVNTCAFVEEAKEQSLEAVMEAAALKQARPGQKVVITGCMAQRYSTELAEQLPEVDAVVGFERYGHLPKTLKTQLGVSVTEKDELAAEESSGSSSTVSRVQVGEATVPFRPELNRHRLTPKHTAYLRVAEGCDHSCSFCAIPGFRGRFRSKPWGAVLQEARVLVDSGVKELNLIAEDTNQYGMDRRDGMGLAQLMRELSQLEGLKWMRILYAYPSYFSDELVEEIASNPKVCKYIDMPLQHISNLTLLAMNRPSQQHTIKLLHKLRSRIPDLALRTTFISGFPGETPEQHKELVKFCADFRFERMGAFAYSQEEGTPAFHYPDMVAEEVRQYRRDELVSQQQRIGERFARTLVGREVDVLVDGCTEDGELYGRTQWDAPDIDPIVFLSQPADSSLPALEIGQIRRCRINSHVTFDLEAHPVA